MSEESEEISVNSGMKERFLFGNFRKDLNEESKNETRGNKDINQEVKESWERMLDFDSMELESNNLIKENSWNFLLNDSEGKFKVFSRDGRS